MPYSGEAKNTQQAAILKKENPTISAEYVSCGTQTEVTLSAGATGTRKLKVSAKVATGTPVVFTNINGKTTAGEAVGSIVIGRLYYAREVSSTEIELAFTKAQAESATEGEHVEVTTELKTSETKLQAIKEASVTARIKTSFGAIANGQGEDAAAREIESTALQSIHWLMYFSALTAGTLVGVSEITERTLASGDIVKVTKTLGEENQGV